MLTALAGIPVKQRRARLVACLQAVPLRADELEARATSRDARRPEHGD